jgi:PAS domain-containing protein
VVLEVVRDITARQQAEAVLRASEARFHTMADAAPVLVWMAGPDMGCTYFCRAAAVRDGMPPPVCRRRVPLGPRSRGAVGGVGRAL